MEEDLKIYLKLAILLMSANKTGNTVLKMSIYRII